MWENDEDEENYTDDECDNWEVKIGKKIEKFETKADALSHILEYVNDSVDNFEDSIPGFGFDDDDDLFNSLLTYSYDDFYETLNKILKYFKIKTNIKLINLDNDEPEFNEL